VLLCVRKTLKPFAVLTVSDLGSFCVCWNPPSTFAVVTDSLFGCFCVWKRPSVYSVLTGSGFGLLWLAKTTKSFCCSNRLGKAAILHGSFRGNMHASDGFRVNMCICGARVDMRGRAEYAGH